MNADERRFKHEDVTQRIIGVFFDVHNELGYGFLESVYREAMGIALESAGLQVEKEFGLEARFRGQLVGVFKDYLRAGVLEVALLLKFGPEPQIRRLAFSNDRKGHSAGEQREFRTRGSGTQPKSICVHPR
jgi:hypothetical protein